MAVRRSLAPIAHTADYIMRHMSPNIDQLTSMLQQCKGGVVAITGAGVSTESGIPDYRSPNRPAYKPLQHGEYMKQFPVRRRYWARSMVGYPKLSSTRPNDTHKLLGKLHSMGVLSHVITQNVDRHHQTAAPALPVLELHGTVHTVSCYASAPASDAAPCEWHAPRGAVQELLLDQNEPWLQQWGVTRDDLARPDGDVVLPEEAYASFHVPTCPSCGSDVLKPDVIFHGGNIPKPVTQRASDILGGAAALLVLGTTLTTWSSFRLARQASAAGLPIAIVNFGDTRADSLEPAPLKIESATSGVLHAVVGKLLKK